MGLTDPGRLKLRAEGDQPEYRRPLRALDEAVEQFERGRVCPLRVLESQQNGALAGQYRKLPGEDGQCQLAPALRVRRRWRIEAVGRQAQQIGEQRNGLRVALARLLQQCFEFVELSFGGVVARKPGCVFQLGDERVKGAVLMVR